MLNLNVCERPGAGLTRRLFVMALCAAGAVTLAPPAHARRRVRLPAAGITRGARVPPGTKVLSRDELRDCVSLEGKVESEASDLEAHDTRIRAKATEVETLDARLASLEPRVDSYDRNSVDNFNGLVDRHRRLVIEYNNMLPAFNAKVDAQDKLITRFNAACASKAYYVDDMTAVRAGR